MPQSKWGSVPEWAQILGRGELGRSERYNEMKCRTGKCPANFGYTSEESVLHSSLGLSLQLQSDHWNDLYWDWQSFGVCACLQGKALLKEEGEKVELDRGWTSQPSLFVSFGHLRNSLNPCGLLLFCCITVRLVLMCSGHIQMFDTAITYPEI